MQPSIDWRFISAADRAIPDDTWIASVLQNEEQQHRWQVWHERPRYAVAVEVGPWAAMAVAFRESTGDNALLDLFRNMDAPQRAAAWAVSRATGQIYRLAMPRVSELSQRADSTEAMVVAAAAEPDVPIAGHATLLTIPAESWQDAPLRARWEVHLITPAHWALSRCQRRLTRVAHPGEFASFCVSEQLWCVGSVFEGVLEVETLSTPRHKRLHERLYRRERMLCTAVMKVLLAQVDQNALRQLRQVRQVQQTGPAAIPGGLSAGSLNWLAEVSGLASGEPGQRRLQALMAAPLLIPWLLAVGNEDTAGAKNDHDPSTQGQAAFCATATATAIEISQTVDSGEPLYPLLMRLTGLSLRTVRHLRLSDLRMHHLIERVDHRATDQVISRLRWLDAIAVEQWPQTPTQWRMWVNTIKALCSQSDLLSDLITQPPHSWIAESPAAHDANASPAFGRGAIALDFYRSLARRRWRLRLGTPFDFPADDGSADALLIAGMELKDFARALREAAHDEWDDYGDPALLPLPEAVSDLLRHWQLEDWWAASQRWHAALTDAGIPPEAHGGRSGAERDGVPWLPLLDRPFRTESENSEPGEPGMPGEHRELNDPTRFGTLTDSNADGNDVRVVLFLCSAGALNAEADAMHNCVGTYVRRCVTGRWHIASLTDGNGVHYSTASFKLCFEQGRWVAKLAEHRGPHNRQPSPRCAHAVGELERLLAKPVMQLRFVAIEAARAETCREQRFAGHAQGQQVSWAALRAALPLEVFEALAGMRR